MKDLLPHVRVRSSNYPLGFYVPVLVISIGAMLSCFAIAIYTADMESKVRGFLVVLITYLVAYVTLFFWHTRKSPGVPAAGAAERSDIDVHLKVLEETRDFFAGSLSTADTFRLVVSRVSQMIDHGGISLLLLDPASGGFVTVQTNGSNSRIGDVIASDNSIVGSCLAERDVFVDMTTSAAAIPLKRETEIFGVLVLDLSDSGEPVAVDASLLDAIGERVAPLFRASIAHDTSRQNALTDHATDLPNERAFHLVLENQVAQTLRTGNSRPLTILSFDVGEHDTIVSRFGHASGDRVLNFVAEAVKENLRQMDFFARGRNAEFLAVMPTASKEIAHEIIARIQASLFERKIKVSDVDAVELELSFGSASFGSDGERPDVLIAAARERKEQAKTPLPGTVVWFPQNIAH